MYDDLEAFRAIQEVESQYKNLPWPNINNIGFLTAVQGGMGDIITSQKAINIIKEELPYVDIDWIVTCEITNIDSIVPLYRFGDNINKSYDLMIIAPVRVGWELSYIETKCNITVKSTFQFYEAAHQMSYHYESLKHHDIFKYPIRDNNSIFGLSMGLLQGTGMILDQDRLKYHKLKDLITTHSINFGYAHRVVNHVKFIQCVCIDEQNLDILILLNKKDDLVIPDVSSYGIGTIFLNGEIIKQGQGRKLSVIQYPKLLTNNIMLLQCISQRLLATGDNTAIESICTYPKLYLYEDVANGGCKRKFATQQINIASNKLGRLLELFIGDYNHFTPDELVEVEEILKSKIEHDVYEFCNTIISNYSFDTIMLNSMKRVLYHTNNPEQWMKE